VIVLVAWLGAVLALGAGGAFMAPPHTPPLALLVGFVVPIVAPVLAYRASARFREWVLGIEPRHLVAPQAWRFAGFSFLTLGDMAIGVTAPWILTRLSASPAFASSRAFVRWNLFGLLDLFLAIGLGAVGGFLLADRPVTTAPMATLPLVLIPAFLVPSFVLMHFAALAQTRRRAA
jgi:hypothetical protein